MKSRQPAKTERARQRARELAAREHADREGWLDYAVNERKRKLCQQEQDNATELRDYWERRFSAEDAEELMRLDKVAASHWDTRYAEFCEFMVKPVAQWAEEWYDDQQLRRANAWHKPTFASKIKSDIRRLFFSPITHITVGVLGLLIALSVIFNTPLIILAGLIAIAAIPLLQGLFFVLTSFIWLVKMTGQGFRHWLR